MTFPLTWRNWCKNAPSAGYASESMGDPWLNCYVSILISNFTYGYSVVVSVAATRCHTAAMFSSQISMQRIERHGLIYCSAGEKYADCAKQHTQRWHNGLWLFFFCVSKSKDRLASSHEALQKKQKYMNRFQRIFPIRIMWTSELFMTTTVVYAATTIAYLNALWF